MTDNLDAKESSSSWQETPYINIQKNDDRLNLLLPGKEVHFSKNPNFAFPAKGTFLLLVSSDEGFDDRITPYLVNQVDKRVAMVDLTEPILNRVHGGSGGEAKALLVGTGQTDLGFIESSPGPADSMKFKLEDITVDTVSAPIIKVGNGDGKSFAIARLDSHVENKIRIPTAVDRKNVTGAAMDILSRTTAWANEIGKENDYQSKAGKVNLT